MILVYHKQKFFQEVYSRLFVKSYKKSKILTKRSKNNFRLENAVYKSLFEVWQKHEKYVKLITERRSAQLFNTRIKRYYYEYRNKYIHTSQKQEDNARTACGKAGRFGASRFQMGKRRLLARRKSFSRHRGIFRRFNRQALRLLQKKL